VQQISPQHAEQQTSPQHVVQQTSPQHAEQQTSPQHAEQQTSPQHVERLTSKSEAVITREQMQDAFKICLSFCERFGRLPYFDITGGGPIFHKGNG
jgi:hypothetical protein